MSKPNFIFALRWIDKLTSQHDSHIFKALNIALILCACAMIGIETDRQHFYANYDFYMLIDNLLILGFVIEVAIRYWADFKTTMDRSYDQLARLKFKQSSGRFRSKFNKLYHRMASDPYLHFFTDPWHIIDIIVIVVCLLPTHTEYFAVFRIFRILRIFLLIDLLDGLKVIVNALVKSMESIAYIVLLLVIHFYIYAVIGTDVFGQYAPARFSHLGQSYLTLFRIVTGDSWSSIMTELESVNPHPSIAIVVLYFVSFMVIGAMIFINLFTSVLTNEVGDAKKEQDALKLMDKKDNKLANFEGEQAQLLMKLDEISRQLKVLHIRYEIKNKE